MAKAKFSIEKAYEELDHIVSALESEELTLEDSFSYYKKGIKLLEQCAKGLDHIEKELIILEEAGE